MNKTYNVTLTFSQLWEIRNNLKAEIRGLTELYHYSEESGYEDGIQIFKGRLSAIEDVLNALPEL